MQNSVIVDTAVGNSSSSVETFDGTRRDQTIVRNVVQRRNTNSIHCVTFQLLKAASMKMSTSTRLHGVYPTRQSCSGTLFNKISSLALLNSIQPINHRNYYSL